ncbi:MAG: hypothetical protein ACKOYN_02545, partial [Planctomycetota bacterium]
WGAWSDWREKFKKNRTFGNTQPLLCGTMSLPTFALAAEQLRDCSVYLSGSGLRDLEPGGGKKGR